ncbi:MAG: hypothetical protein DMD93_00165 [Candidatus Rokuibacteriota bacterium]|nr:MAG: hypothetical protein DMD93_00165 [Candidatus Rokubacteria bacterium]
MREPWTASASWRRWTRICWRGSCSGSRTGSSTGRGPDRSGVRSPSAWRSRSNFSFVTLATLGYGDVVPVSEPARGLAIVE